MPGCRPGDALSLPAGEALSKVRGERGPGAGPEGGMQPGREPWMGGGCGGGAGILGDAAPGAPRPLGCGKGALAAADLSWRESLRLRVLKMSATLLAQ